MAVSEKRSSDTDVHQLVPKGVSRLQRLVECGFDGTEQLLNQILPQNAVSRNTRRLMGSDLVDGADVFQLHALHWPKRNFSVDTAARLAARGPVFWTLHDMWPFTGHCTYSYDCQRWKEACGECPDLRQFVPLAIDTTALNHRFKRQVYGSCDFVIVSPSRWLADLARASPLFAGKRVEHIPYGIDLDIFRPLPKEEARAKLSLPQDARIFLCVAFDFADPRKGFDLFWEALARQTRPVENMLILAMGHGSPPPEVHRRYRVRTTGFLSELKRQVVAYSAADVLVFPTLGDNLPNTILESMACATPALAFSVGGVPDLVRHGETGYLAPPRDAAALAEGVRWFAEDSERLRRLQHQAAAEIATTYPYRLQAERYRALYVEALQRDRSKQRTMVG